MKNLKAKTLHALSWSAFESAWRIGIRFAVGIILARLLDPGEYGLIGMLAVFIGLGNALADSGFGSALIQKPNLSDKDTSSVFYFNLVAALVMASAIYIGAPAIASFYAQKSLANIARVLSLVVVINSLSLVHIRLLSKEMNFKLQAHIGILATIASGAVAIAMALAGHGVWSLVAQQISDAGLRTLMLWIRSPWRPSLEFSLRSIRSMFHFGSRVMAVGLVNAAANNVSSVLIGKFYSAADLGYVDKAKGLAQMPFTNLTTAFGRVLFPSFAAVQHDKKRLKSAFRQIVRGMAALVLPMAVGLVATARPLVMALLTSKWEPCIPYLRIASIGLSFYVMYDVYMALLKGTGQSDRLLRLETGKRICAVVAVVAAVQWGILAMMWSSLFVTIAAYLFSCLQAARQLDYRWHEQIRDLAPYAGASAALAAVVMSIGAAPITNPWLMLSAQTAGGVLAYGLLAIRLKFDILSDATSMLKARFGSGAGSRR